MTTRKLLLFSLLSGLLLTPAWYEWGNGLILAIALIPLLYVEDFLDQHQAEFGSRVFFKYASITFLVWNIATTWWIVNAAIAGVIAAVIINTFMWSLVAWFFHIAKRKLGPQLGYLSLILFWISWEFIYHNSEISWPWLSLGNGFAYNIRLIQWYEYTGIMGGTLWVLVLNILIFILIKNFRSGIPKSKLLAQTGLILVILLGPIAISLVRFNTYVEKTDPKTIVVIQPNIDPYEKFIAIPSLEQTMVQLTEAAKVADSTVDYFIAPETSINNSIWTDQLETCSRHHNDPEVSRCHIRRQHMFLEFNATSVIYRVRNSVKMPGKSREPEPIMKVSMRLFSLIPQKKFQCILNQSL